MSQRSISSLSSVTAQPICISRCIQGREKAPLRGFLPMRSSNSSICCVRCSLHTPNVNALDSSVLMKCARAASEPQIEKPMSHTCGTFALQGCRIVLGHDRASHLHVHLSRRPTQCCSNASVDIFAVVDLGLVSGVASPITQKNLNLAAEIRPLLCLPDAPGQALILNWYENRSRASRR